MNDMQTLFRRAAQLESQALPYALVTVVRALAPTSANAGDKAIVCGDGTIYGWIGGGCAQPAVIRAVRQALSDGKPRNVRITPDKSGEEMLEDMVEFTMACHSGGTIELFVEPVLPKPELVVFGASPVAQSLVSLAPRVGFRVTWVDEATALAEGAEEVPRIGHRQLTQIAAGAFAVVATQGKGDLQALQGALSLRARHIAFVASGRKGDLLKESLASSGADPTAVAAIEAPAGYIIDAQTPEEIALSVLVSLVSRRRAGVRTTAHSAADATPSRSVPVAKGPQVAQSSSHACCGDTAEKTVPVATARAGSCCDSAATLPATGPIAAGEPHAKPSR
jgi:xanthine dehydrogenase accessory factor